MKKFLIILILGLVFLGCEKKDDAVLKTGFKTGDIITLKGVEGGEKKLKRLENGFELVGDKNKIVMLDIFGTFCPPCQNEAPNLTALQIEKSDKLVIIGLTYLEDVDDEYVVENFSDKYNAHYFISNSKQNEKIVQNITEDIGYEKAVLLPFKVVLKNGKYQTLKDVWEGKSGLKFYVGDVGINTIKSDLKAISERN